ncbi:MAG: hypothetical protein DSY58_08220 [Desulfobulbus sp.]|nr:MAG: hypothetical protein DSY58_08220 [Desulfobulbus sp.]
MFLWEEVCKNSSGLCKDFLALKENNTTSPDLKNTLVQILEKINHKIMFSPNSFRQFQLL